MTLISANKTEGCTAQIKFSISGEQFKAEVEKVYRKQVANITIPGFRKGKAPKSMIEKMYGKGFFYEEAINNLLPTEYPLALEESKLEAVSAPEIDIEEITDEKVVIIATIKVKPEVTVDEYKGIEVTRKVEEVKPAEVEAEIERVRQRNSRTVEITDRAAENGDMVVIDYSGSVDGVKFDGGTAEKQNLELGSGSFIPGFEEQVVGHAIGESFDITVTFPAEYHAPDLAGKEAVFAITLHEIKKVELPELDDEFARDVSEFDTLDEYKADIEAKIKSSKENQADQEVEGQLIDALIERLHADIPEEMFVTVWLGILEISTGKLIAANAGHEYPILKRAGEDFELFKDRHGLVIGAMDGVRYRDYEILLEPGAKLFVYTDGLSEAANASMEQFGTERTLTALRECGDGSPKKLIGAVNAAVKAFVDDAPQFDDLTMLCVEYKRK
jgi:trigger factor